MGPDDYMTAVTLTGFVDAAKTLAGPVVWVEDGRNLRFTVPLDIDGVTEPGLTLIGRAGAAVPDRHVALGLGYRNPLGVGGTFERIDWKPLDAHVNRGRAPDKLRFVRIAGTHRHRWSLNAPLGAPAALDDLPDAEAIESEPADWQALLHVAAALWRIADPTTIPIPPWQYDLLPFDPQDPDRGGPG